MQTGLIYDTRAPNPYAAAIQQKLREAVEEFRKELVQESGMHTVRDADVLGVLVFCRGWKCAITTGADAGGRFAIS